MRWIVQFVRLLHINYILVKHGMDRVVFVTPHFNQWRFLSYLNPWNWWRDKNQPLAVSVRLALEALGPIFVKFGQILSTRPDIFPDDIIVELSKLQDNVPPFSSELAKEMIEAAYGCRLEDVFVEFNLSPLASASIAQVHAATLKNGDAVVVKVIRPNIKKLIQRDVGLMYLVANLTERFWSQGYRLRPKEVVAEFEQTIFDELDLMREAANASQLRRNFAGSTMLTVPKVYWDFTRGDVMVMERIYGIPVSDIAELQRQKFDMRKLAENGVEIFFTQVFRDSFFHADMHPGNIFVSKANPANPHYLAVDFGIMGTLSPNDQRYLAENLLAFFHRDYRQVAILHVESGWVPAGTRIDAFESAIRCVCEPIFERPLKEISFGRLLLKLFQTAGRFQMEVQPQLLLLQKTLLNIEGLGRQLYPDLDLWANAKPYLERWMQEKVGVKALAKTVCAKAPFWAEKLTDMPDMVYRALQEHMHVLRQAQQPVQPIRYERKRPMKRLLMGGGIALVLAAVINLWFLDREIELRYVTELSVISLGVLLMLASAFTSTKTDYN
ncbi:MAG: ubiquinone biosynthesis regulatory protein kinase UbiB [Pseudomonadota bacterium]|nr:ubiquinone biosynthesis regulatory protein kinase UbiB [Pseudomonadota bacterium]